MVVRKVDAGASRMNALQRPAIEEPYRGMIVYKDAVGVVLWLR